MGGGYVLVYALSDCLSNDKTSYLCKIFSLKMDQSTVYSKGIPLGEIIRKKGLFVFVGKRKKAGNEREREIKINASL